MDQQYFKLVIKKYKETKTILSIVNDFNRHDKTRNQLLRLITVEHLHLMNEFVKGLEDHGIKAVIREVN